MSPPSVPEGGESGRRFNELAKTRVSQEHSSPPVDVHPNPATTLDSIEWALDQLDMVLLMSVNPGFGGQSYIPYVTDKIRALRAMIDESGKDIRLEIDGGVKVDNIGEIAAAGADTFVAGSAIFGSADYAKTIAAMREEIANSKS